jgi:ring-1,2-phenylacetyl-CoA epoxidase subunit PaaC
VKQLGSATPESISRLQGSLEFALPYAFGIFEPSPFENELIAENIFSGEAKLKDEWVAKITAVIKQSALRLPELSTVTPVYGGRVGRHSEHLQPLLNEMSEVFKIDPGAEW